MKPIWAFVSIAAGIIIGVGAIEIYQHWSPNPTAAAQPVAAAAQNTIPIPSPVGDNQYVTAPSVPKFADVKRVDESFVLQPAQVRWYPLPDLRKPGEHLHIRYRSQYPVTLGLMPTGDLSQERVKSAWFRSFMQNSVCAESQVTSIDISCPMPPGAAVTPYALVVLDDRSGGTVAAGGLAAMLGAKRMLSDAIAPNNAALVVSQRRCVDNCSN